MPSHQGLPVSSYRSREMSAPRRMVLPAKSAVLLLTSSAAPVSCRSGQGELGIRPVIPREIHCPVPAGGGEVFHHDLLFRYALRQDIGVVGSRLGKGRSLPSPSV